MSKCCARAAVCRRPRRRAPSRPRGRGFQVRRDRVAQLGVVFWPAGSRTVVPGQARVARRTMVVAVTVPRNGLGQVCSIWVRVLGRPPPRRRHRGRARRAARSGRWRGSFRRQRDTALEAAHDGDASAARPRFSPAPTSDVSADSVYASQDRPRMRARGSVGRGGYSPTCRRRPGRVERHRLARRARIGRRPAALAHGCRASEPASRPLHQHLRVDERRAARAHRVVLPRGVRTRSLVLPAQPVPVVDVERRAPITSSRRPGNCAASQAGAAGGQLSQPSDREGFRPKRHERGAARRDGRRRRRALPRRGPP